MFTEAELLEYAGFRHRSELEGVVEVDITRPTSQIYDWQNINNLKILPRLQFYYHKMYEEKSVDRLGESVG